MNSLVIFIRGGVGGWPCTARGLQRRVPRGAGVNELADLPAAAAVPAAPHRHVVPPGQVDVATEQPHHGRHDACNHEVLKKIKKSGGRGPRTGRRTDASVPGRGRPRGEQHAAHVRNAEQQVMVMGVEVGKA